MPKKSYALEREAPRRLELEWGRSWSPLTVRWDGEVVGEYGGAELDRGVRVTLPGGTVIRLSLAAGGFFGGKGLSLRLADGTPLPGSDHDPMEAAKQGGYTLFVIAGLSAFCGAIAIASGAESLAAAGIGVGSLVMAVIYGVLGLFTMRGSRVALAIAIAVYGLDWIAGFVMAAADGANPGVGGMFVRIMFLAAMGRAFMAMGGPRAS